MSDSQELPEEPAVSGEAVDKEEEESVNGDEDEGETRCICGEMDPPDGSGLFIQCEECGVWQHGCCVGILEGEDLVLDKYWCEQCKPNLHRLYNAQDTGALKSVYKPVHNKRTQNERKRRNERSRKNKVKKDIDSPTEKEEEPEKVEEEVREEVDEAKMNSTSANKDVVEESKVEETERRSIDRQRATFSAREEKQYQLMLEKAIKESAMTSASTTVADGEGEHTIQLEEDPETFSPEKVLLKEESNLMDESELIQKPKQIAVAKRDSDLANLPGPLETDSRTKSKLSSTPATQKKSSPLQKRQQRITKRVNKRSASSNVNYANNSQKTEPDINKPVKPRIPPQRTSLNEMRRRVAAILEFISRTQWELSQQQQSKDDLIRFVENQQFVKQVDNIFDNYDESLKLMDELTRSLLFWEKKYSNAGSLND